MIIFQFIKYLRNVYLPGYKTLKYKKILNLSKDYFDTIFINFQNNWSKNKTCNFEYLFKSILFDQISK